jgi:salicylate hydroxylase
MPIGLPDVPPRTEDMLEFIVIGGGIAGLACAYSLKEAGHQVTVLEQSDGHYKSHGIIRSPPNMTCTLDYWGMGETLAERSVKDSGVTLLAGATGENIGLFLLHDKLMKTLPGKFYFLQHAGLHTMLFDFAEKAGVKILHDTKVVSVDPWSGTVTTAQGTEMSADVIVGADGYSSIVRPVVVSPQAFEGVRDKFLSVSIIVPADKMRQHEDLAPFLETSGWTVWLADECSIHGVCTGPNQDYALVAVVPMKEEAVEEVWFDYCPINSELLRLHLFEPRVQKLVRLAENMFKIKSIHHDPFDNWVHESGKVVIIGEAAHPIVPNGIHNASLCIEDAMTLSMLFSLPATRSQTSMLLTAYEDIRQPRCAAVQSNERQRRNFFCMPNGPEQHGRDERLGGSRDVLIDWDNTDEEILRTTFADHLQHFDFDAREGVHDWWTKWGKATRTPRGQPNRPLDPAFEPLMLDADVTVVREIPPQSR